MTRQLLLLELNEVNFEFVEAYVARGDLPHIGRLIGRHGYERTTSEQQYEQLEPWIQWVTAHTGRSFAEHGVFRLGDIVDRDIPQIWELLEEKGLKVGAISPMNAKHRVRDPAFFVPDPWTRTAISAPPVLRGLYAALRQVVNDNATAAISASSLVALVAGLLRYARQVNYPRYLALAARSIMHPWRRALFLDLLLSDVFIREVRRTQPNFATLFLNAAAHIQHHYMFSASPYEGAHRNPSWYIRDGMDPVRDSYALYDRVVGHVQAAFPDARVMLATGLHQVPRHDATYYWRLRDHVDFLRMIDVPFAAVVPLMSRDFLITCADAHHAKLAEARLKTSVHQDGVPLFEVDNRGRDLFVMLTYPYEIKAGCTFLVGGRPYPDLSTHVAFVALKNGEHNGIGYFLDTGATVAAHSREFPLAQMVERIFSALGLSAADSRRSAA